MFTETEWPCLTCDVGQKYVSGQAEFLNREGWAGSLMVPDGTECR